MYIRRMRGAAAGLALLATPVSAPAQALGIGPRMSFVRPDPALDSPGDRYTGAALRLKMSPRTAIEVAMDWRSTASDDGTARVRDYPLQASLLLYPVRAAIGPYLLGGVGWYSQRLEALSGDDVVSTETERRRGYHAGLGGELTLGRRATLFADYRYTSIGFGRDASVGGLAAGFLFPGAGSLADYLRLSHDGSMWSAGILINF